MINSAMQKAREECPPDEPLSSSAACPSRTPRHPCPHTALPSRCTGCRRRSTDSTTQSSPQLQLPKQLQLREALPSQLSPTRIQLNRKFESRLRVQGINSDPARFAPWGIASERAPGTPGECAVLEAAAGPVVEVHSFFEGPALRPSERVINRSPGVFVTSFTARQGSSPRTPN